MFNKKWHSGNSSNFYLVLLGLILGFLMVWDGLIKGYRLSHWIKTSAIILTVEIKQVHNSNIKGYGFSKRAVYTLAFKIKDVPYFGMLTKKQQKPTYEKNQPIKILINPDNSEQIDFYYKPETIFERYALGAFLFALCSTLLIADCFKMQSLC